MIEPEVPPVTEGVTLPTPFRWACRHVGSSSDFNRCLFANVVGERCWKLVLTGDSTKANSSLMSSHAVQFD